MVKGLKIHLQTWEEEEKVPALIDDLEDIKDDLTNIGIEFTYEFRDFHDRCIASSFMCQQNEIQTFCKTFSNAI